MAPTPRIVALGNGVSLSYVDQGDPGGPVLLLLPGPTDSWRSYAAILDRMPHTIRTVAVSQRGHGDSAKPRSGYSVRHFAGDVVPLLEALDIEHAVLAGHSGSCLVARRVALDQPSLVAGLVLEASPMTLRGNPALEHFIRTTISALADPIDATFARSFLMDTSSKALPRPFVDELVGEVVKVPARVWREMFADLLQYDDTFELSSVTAPALLVWGDADPLVSRDAEDHLVGNLPYGELVVYGETGHAPRWQLPSRFAADVASFVERCTAAAT